MKGSRTTGIALCVCGFLTLLANLLSPNWPDSSWRPAFIVLAILLVLGGVFTLS